tara:strand:- start:364 stop:681 length:318 start_codon:yes stop_codon:yes gene_type:complete
MKVKISYNLSLEDVPSHVADLVQNVSQEFHSLSQHAASLSHQIREQSLTAHGLVQTLNDIRVQLEKTDTLLNDFGSILIGFEQVKLSPEILTPQEDPEEKADEES